MMIQPIDTTYGSQIGDVEFIWARNSKEFLFANSILIKGKPSIIVDPSATFTYIDALASSKTVDMVLNTHYHGDHRSLNGLFKNSVFASHELDAPAIRSYEVYEKYNDNNPESVYSIWRKMVFEQNHIVDCPVSKLFKGDELIETDTTQIQLVHIPGHTPGHMALWFKNISCLYLSDIDLTPYGPWYANVESNLDDFIQSVKKVKKIEVDHYVTSHGERIYDREKFLEKITRFENCFEDRDNKIIDFLKNGPQIREQIASEGIVYKRLALSDPLKAYFQWQMVGKHLERLIKLKVIEQDGEYYKIR